MNNDNDFSEIESRLALLEAERRTFEMDAPTAQEYIDTVKAEGKGKRATTRYVAPQGTAFNEVFIDHDLAEQANEAKVQFKDLLAAQNFIRKLSFMAAIAHRSLAEGNIGDVELTLEGIITAGMGEAERCKDVVLDRLAAKVKLFAATRERIR
ncbi:hypothetical protein H4S06_001064 [Coemansia sp. BCRC 34490]|nr:hypothetical protein H4S06_001064 [Coemansia sp. BCRC 34490]